MATKWTQVETPIGTLEVCAIAPDEHDMSHVNIRTGYDSQGQTKYV